MKIENREYRIIESSSIEDLERRINEYTECGAVPVGNVAYIPATPSGVGSRLLQVIYKPEPEGF